MTIHADPAPMMERKLIHVSQAQMDAAYALHRHAPCRTAESGVMQLQFICRTADVEEMLPLLTTAIWCCQMTTAALHIRLVTEDGEALRRDLLQRMPLLAAYTNLQQSNPPYCYVNFAVETDADVALACRSGSREKKAAAAAARALAERWDAPWTALMLGDALGGFLHLYAPALPAKRGAVLVVNCARRAIAPADAQLLSRSRTLHCMQGASPARAAFEERMWRSALRLHQTYQTNGHTSNNVAGFDEHAGNQYSSFAAALHIAWKLRDVGLNPDMRDKEALAAAYVSRVLCDGTGRRTPAQQQRYEQLVGLEHRRWLMHEAVCGWLPASMDQCRAYCFEHQSGLAEPVFRFRIESGTTKLHPALVPGGGTMALQALSRDEWDAFTTEAAIDETAYDPLDRVSLKLHLMAGQKIAAQEELRERHLKELHDLTLSDPSALRAAQTFIHWFRQFGVRKHPARMEAENFQTVRSICLRAHVDAQRLDAVLGALRRDLRVVNEFHAYNDYKVADAAIVEHLAEIWCVPEHVRVFKLGAEGMLENVTAALLLAPERLVVYGVDKEAGDRISAMLQNHPRVQQVQCCPLPAAEELLRDMRKRLLQEVHQLPQDAMLAVDITGASPALVSAVWSLRTSCRELAGLGLVRCNSRTQTVENVADCPMAPAIRRRVQVTVKELMSLYGAKPANHDLSSQNSSRLIQLQDSFERAWRFRREDRKTCFQFARIMKGLMEKKNQGRPVMLRLLDQPTTLTIPAGADGVAIHQMVADICAAGQARANPNQDSERKASMICPPMLHAPMEELQKRLLTSTRSTPCFAIRGDVCGVYLRRWEDEEAAVPETLDELPELDDLPDLDAEAVAVDASSVEGPQDTGEPFVVSWPYVGHMEDVVTQRVELHRPALQSGHLERLLAVINADAAKRLNCALERDLVDPEKMYLVITGPAKNCVPLAGVLNRAMSGRTTPELVYESSAVISVMHATDPLNDADHCAIAAAAARGIVTTYSRRKDGSALFRFTDPNYAMLFRLEGTPLECYTWYAAAACDFDDVQNGYAFDWGTTSNELDVLATRGLELVIISCKDAYIYPYTVDQATLKKNFNTTQSKYNMYEVSMLARQLGSSAHPVLLYLSPDVVWDPERRRAESIGVTLLTMDGLSNDLDPQVRETGKSLRQTLQELLD